MKLPWDEVGDDDVEMPTSTADYPSSEATIPLGDKDEQDGKAKQEPKPATAIVRTGDYISVALGNGVVVPTVITRADPHTSPPRKGRKLIVRKEVWQELLTWLFVTRGVEISGLGYIVEDGQDFVWNRMWACSDDMSGGSTRLNAERQCEILMEAIADGLCPSGLRMFWHTHTGRAFWSCTDLKAIDDEVSLTEGRPVVNFVGEPNGEGEARVDWENEDGDHVSEALTIVFEGLEEYEKYVRDNRAKITTVRTPRIPVSAWDAADLDPYWGWTLGEHGSLFPRANGYRPGGLGPSRPAVAPQQQVLVPDQPRTYHSLGRVDAAQLTDVEQAIIVRGLCPFCNGDTIPYSSGRGAWCPECRTYIAFVAV